MHMSRRNLMSIGSIGAAGAIAGVAMPALAAAKTKPMAAPSAMPAIPQADGKTLFTADQALARLKEGNRRFVADQPTQPDISSRRRMELSHGQAPYCAIVCCSDSRAGPEQLFGAGLGELFIVRTAGNYVDTAGMGSLEFGVAALGVPLIVVLGHESCGAVKAAIGVVKNNDSLPGTLDAMVQPILPAVIKAKSALKDGEDLVAASAHANVSRVVKQLRNVSEPMLMTPQKAGKVKVVGGYYDLDTGAVNFFDV